MVIKVQKSLVGSEGRQHLLLYNKKRSIYFEKCVEPDDPILEAMKGKLKSFFKAEIVGKVLPNGRILDAKTIRIKSETWERKW